MVPDTGNTQSSTLRSFGSRGKLVGPSTTSVILEGSVIEDAHRVGAHPSCPCGLRGRTHRRDSAEMRGLDHQGRWGAMSQGSSPLQLGTAFQPASQEIWCVTILVFPQPGAVRQGGEWRQAVPWHPQGLEKAEAVIPRAPSSPSAARSLKPPLSTPPPPPHHISTQSW